MRVAPLERSATGKRDEAVTLGESAVHRFCCLLCLLCLLACFLLLLLLFSLCLLFALLTFRFACLLFPTQDRGSKKPWQVFARSKELALTVLSFSSLLV